jgi:hypothetical protein
MRIVMRRETMTGILSQAAWRATRQVASSFSSIQAAVTPKKRVPRLNSVNFRLHFRHPSGINNLVESSVWLAGHLCATLVACPASN